MSFSCSCKRDWYSLIFFNRTSSCRSTRGGRNPISTFHERPRNTGNPWGHPDHTMSRSLHISMLLSRKISLNLFALFVSSLSWRISEEMFGFRSGCGNSGFWFPTRTRLTNRLNNFRYFCEADSMNIHDVIYTRRSNLHENFSLVPLSRDLLGIFSYRSFRVSDTKQG